jgi:hypothetical protein
MSLPLPAEEEVGEAELPVQLTLGWIRLVARAVAPPVKDIRPEPFHLQAVKLRTGVLPIRHVP